MALDAPDSVVDLGLRDQFGLDIDESFQDPVT